MRTEDRGSCGGICVLMLDASKKKHVPGDTLAVGDTSSSQVNVDQEIGALATPGAPSTSSFAESPLVRAQQEINEEQLVEVSPPTQ